MSKRVGKIGPNRTVAHAIGLMKEHNSNILAVVEEFTGGQRKILGLVGHNRFKGIKEHSSKMKDLMKKDIKCVNKDMVLSEVLNLRKDNRLKYTPVLDDDESFLGIITDTSILNVLTDAVPESEEY